MKTRPAKLAGVLVVEPLAFEDGRGRFMETYQQRRYIQAGVDRLFVQDNQSVSGRGVLRGLHYQIPHPQGKLVRVERGQVFDVAVDLRRWSRTFGQWTAELLSDENRRQLYIPPGLAHGFCVLSRTAQVAYKCTDYYYPEHERTLLWSDPRLAIQWPLEDPILSEKDRAGLTLDEAPCFEQPFELAAAGPARPAHARPRVKGERSMDLLSPSRSRRPRAVRPQRPIALFRPCYDQREADAVADVLRSGWAGLGPKTEEFEERFARLVGARYAVATNSCTSALEIALRLIGVGPGDEVIVPTITFLATAHAAVSCGASPVFCDVRPDTLMLDWQDVERRRTPPHQGHCAGAVCGASRACAADRHPAGLRLRRRGRLGF